MLLDDQTFRNLMLKITGTNKRPVNYKYQAKFINEETNEMLDVHNVLAFNIASDYQGGTSDYLHITVEVFKSVYFKLLRVNRRKLRLELTRIPNAVTGADGPIEPAIVEQYDAFLTDNTSEAIETRSGGMVGSHLDDLGALIEIPVQLMERGMAEFRLWEAGGVYRNVTVGDLLIGLMSQPLEALSQTTPKGYQVTLHPSDNKEKYYQRLIPNGIRLIDLPGWMQKEWGVYSSGLGYYLHQGMWYIYPLYDVTRYEKAMKRLTIVNVPVNEMTGHHNSYIKEDKDIYILATGNTHHEDNADRSLDETGTGIRAAKPENILSHFVKNDKGKTTIPPNHNRMNISFEERKGNFDNIRSKPGLFSKNVWDDASRVIAGMGNTVTVKWEYSNPSLIVPGMPIKMVYMYLGKPYSLFGVVLAAQTTVQTPMQSLVDNRYVSVTHLTLYTERADK